MTTPPRDDGATLIELVVVTVIMGLVVATIAATFVAVVRATPATEARIDDARTLLGVTIHLPADVNSTPSGGFLLDSAVDAADAGCLGPTTSTSANLVQMTWSELSTTYRATYRYESVSSDPGDNRKIVRYFCAEGGGPTTRQSMTSELPPAAGDPVTVSAIVDGSGATVGITMEITTIDGKRLGVDSRSNNPAETLPPVPPVAYPPVPPGNSAPIANPVFSNAEPNVERDVVLAGVDPDGDGLIATLDLAGVPDDWVITPGGMTVTVRPPAGAVPGVDFVTFGYTVVDPFGQNDSSTVTIDVLSPPVNAGPSAGHVDLTLTENAPHLFNLPVSDPDGDPLTISWAGADPSLNVTTDGTTMTIVSDGSVGNPPPFTYTVSDGSLSASATIDVSVIVCDVTGFASSESDGEIERHNGNKRLTGDVTYTVAYTGPCTNLVLEYDHNLDNGYDATYLSFGSGFDVTVDGHPGGLTPWSLGPHDMLLRDGIGGTIIQTLTLEVVPE